MQSSFSAENVQFDWNPGFRVGFGHKLDEQSWDVKLYWTYFRTSQDAQVSVENAQTGAVVPEFFSGLVGSVVDGIPIFSQGIDRLEPDLQHDRSGTRKELCRRRIGLDSSVHWASKRPSFSKTCI